MTRAVFMGTPQIAVPALEALCGLAEVAFVITQPDRPAGRGLELRVPEVKVRALERGLKVLQPTKVRDGSLERLLRDAKIDVALVMAYGRILPKGVLEAPRFGCLNLHASLLPALRGAAPIQRAVMQGDRESGISLMQMDEGMDTGPVWSRHTLELADDETAGSLAERLSLLAQQVVLEELPRVLSGQGRPIPQQHALATHAPPLGPEDRGVDFARAAAAIDAQVRGLLPRPGAETTLKGKRLKLWQTRPHAEATAGQAGEVMIVERQILIATGQGTLEILAAQLEGRKRSGAEELINGRVLASGDVLGKPAGTH